MAKVLPSLHEADWLQTKQLQSLLRAIAAAGGEARVAGGAVRNALLGEAVQEIDIATSLPPERIMTVCRAAKFAVHPTGIEHGTVTVVVHGTPYEVTTLRRDVTTDGRHATVKFTDDWHEDALRRDFTINAMYVDSVGKVYDYTNGYRDIQTRKVRFVGTPADRIREDYLRILRFFRFHARYGKGAPDAGGLAACVRLKKGITTLSAERLRQEMLKLLVAPRALPTLKVMAAHKILKTILPYRENWRAISRLPADGILRLAMLAQDPATLKHRFRLSNEEARRISQLFDAPTLSPKLRDAEQRKLLYELKPQTWADAVALNWAKGRAAVTDSKWQNLSELPSRWKRPVLPVNGKDLLQLGLAAGPELGATLARLEDWWIASDFQPGRAELLRKVIK